MAAPATKQQENIPALAMSESELIDVLRNSLYPGAKDESIKLVIGYCRASQLDPMQKPVHIVPMSVKKAGTNQYEWRDVVMPGIGLYRTQAARSGQYAGVTEPEFGEDVTETLNNVTVTYPKWCRVTVKRQMASGQIVEFTAKELWKENYATASRDSEAPNSMWKRRPYAQLAKCCEAQALRKAFPEFGAQPTADEMEGKTFDEPRDITPRQEQTPPPAQPQQLPIYPDDRFAECLPGWRDSIDAKRNTAERLIAMISSKYTLTDEQIDAIRKLEAIEGEIV